MNSHCAVVRYKKGRECDLVVIFCEIFASNKGPVSFTGQIFIFVKVDRSFCLYHVRNLRRTVILVFLQEIDAVRCVFTKRKKKKIYLHLELRFGRGVLLLMY